MDSPGESPDRPIFPGLSWRPLQSSDAEAIADLARQCHAADGGHPLGAADAYLREQYQSHSIGGFESNGRLAACAAVRPTHTSEAYRATLVGQVHPDFRRRGIGTFLLE